MIEAGIQTQADEDFSRARSLEIITRIKSLLTSKNFDMLSLGDVRSLLKIQGERHRGMKTVRINSIVGSEGRYADFNKSFLPKRRYMRQRWTRVDTAFYKDISLPAIRLYEVGGVYFVRDGNHRVSVAKSQGVEFIDAEVVSLDTEVKLQGVETMQDLRSAVIDYEHKKFYEATQLDRLEPDCDIRFTAPGRYEDIIVHINCHKYYINLDKSEEIPFREAMLSWYENVYTPVCKLVRKEELLSLFPRRSEADLYVWIVRHWDELKKKYGSDFPLHAAAQDFKKRFGRGPLRRLLDWVRRLVIALRKELAAK